MPRNDSRVELLQQSSDKAALLSGGRRERALVGKELIRVSSRLRIVDDEGNGKRGFCSKASFCHSGSSTARNGARNETRVVRIWSWKISLVNRRDYIC
jgi:hypothetical protein